LLAAEAWLRVRRPDVTRLSAEVLGDNERSHRLFQSAGYHPRSSTYDKRVQA
jgi:RimJ/RimL family protein N-acetyltransferase